VYGLQGIFSDLEIRFAVKIRLDLKFTSLLLKKYYLYCFFVPYQNTYLRAEGLVLVAGIVPALVF